MSDELTGLLASIFKDRGKSYANGGISERYDEVLVIGAGIDGPFTEQPGRPTVMIVQGNLAGTLKAIVIGSDWNTAPSLIGKTVGPMFGGCFIYSSDSRFNKVTGGVPVPLHDRYETPAEYARLST